MNKAYIMLILLIGMCSYQAQAQVRPNLGSTTRLLNQAVDAMEREDFPKANEYFRQIIQSNVPIPPEMPYLFAETLFHLGQFDNSQNFLNKYLDLNGFKGEHYEEARELKAKLVPKMEEIKSCQFCDRKGYRLVDCTTCNGSSHIEQDCRICRGNGIVGCSRCAGKGLVTKKNVFNIVEYYDCERCDGNGRLTCLKCEGDKVEYGECQVCQGAGVSSSEVLCDHNENNQLKERRTSFKMPDFHP
jgi:tetratricopeptide (TPR) repeat protein